MRTVEKLVAVCGSNLSISSVTPIAKSFDEACAGATNATPATIAVLILNIANFLLNFTFSPSKDESGWTHAVKKTFRDFPDL
jgi:hypothetical protein